MNRLKLLFLLLIIAALAIVFIQNQEPITLKLLCPDTTQACLYQSRPFPLAVWIGLFTLAGILTNLLGQVFSRYGYTSSSKPRPTNTTKPKYTDSDFYPDQQNWVDENREQQFQRGENQRNYSSSSTQVQNNPILDGFNKSNSYEKPQEPQNVERSGSTYSYTYRPASEQSSSSGSEASSPNLNSEPLSDVKDSKAKTSNYSLRNSNVDAQDDDEDWI
jgi:hypothetical protein